MIVLKNVTKKFGKTSVLTDVSFEISPGEFVCITGPSGAGKSTLIHLLAGAELPTHGKIEVDNVDLRAVPLPVMQIYRRRIGVVFQDYKLLMNRTVWENVAFPLEVCGIPKVQIANRVTEVLKNMQLEEHSGSLPDALSGGEKARTAIARAVVHKPMVVMADEPTGNIDPVQSQMILQLLKDINAGGATVILATHDTALVDTLQTRVIRLENGCVMRDSRGGYETEGEGVPGAAQGTHEVFAGVEDRVPKKDDEPDEGKVDIQPSN